MNRYVEAEREALADALVAAGPDAPTLCTGWTTRDLAAHVVVRERRPDATLGLVVPWLRGRLERVQAARAARPYPELVEELRHPPWWSPVSNPLLNGPLNATELFIHHEDVRRGGGGWAPRDLPGAYEAEIWSRVQTLGRWALRRWPAAVLLDAPGFGQCRAGRPGERLLVVGAPAELLLFISGRQRAARANVSGPPELAERLRDAPLGQ